MGFYLKRVVTKDTPADVADRVRYQAIIARVYAERNARFPAITSENLAEAAKWQEDRIVELRGQRL